SCRSGRSPGVGAAGSGAAGRSGPRPAAAGRSPPLLEDLQQADDAVAAVEDAIAVVPAGPGEPNVAPLPGVEERDQLLGRDALLEEGEDLPGRVVLVLGEARQPERRGELEGDEAAHQLVVDH